MARDARENFQRQHGISGEGTMAGGEPSTAAGVGEAIRTSPEQTNHTGA